MFVYQFVFSHCTGCYSTGLRSQFCSPRGKQWVKNDNITIGQRRGHLIQGDFPSYYKEITDSETDSIDSMVSANDDMCIMNPKIDPRNDSSDDDIYTMNQKIDQKNHSENLIKSYSENITNKTVIYVCSIKNSNGLSIQSDINVNFDYLKNVENEETKIVEGIYTFSKLINKTIEKLTELKEQMNSLSTEQNVTSSFSFENYMGRKEKEKINKIIMMTASNSDFVIRWLDSSWLLNFDSLINYLKDKKIQEELNIITNYNKIVCDQIDIYEINGIIFCEIMCVQKGYIWNNKYKINMWPHQSKLSIKKVN